MKITAAVCTYNGERYILEQLNSILNQSIMVDEIIICDDQSTDKTIEIINSLIKSNPGIIQFHINDENLKVNKNFEKAISLSTGDYIFLSDQDDVWKEDKVEHILEVFEQNPTAQGVFSNAYLIDDEGNKRGSKSLWDKVLFIENTIKNQKELYSYISNVRNMVTGATLCLKRETKNFIFPFPDSRTMYHDEWIALILSFKNTLYYTTKKLISYRVHDSQQIGVIKTSVLKENSLVIESIIYKKYPKKFQKLYLIYKSYFRNYNKFVCLKKSYTHKINFDLDNIIDTNKNNIIDIELSLRKSNLIFFYFKKLADKIAGKRQLN
jgi:glycosyltransferase involved in cell wall biosynthesis